MSIICGNIYSYASSAGEAQFRGNGEFEIIISEQADIGYLPGDVDKLIDDAGDTNVWIINARCPSSWCTQNNTLLDEVAAEHSNVKVIDWFGASSGHDNYLSEDGMNLTAEGADAYAATVKKAMGL